MTIPISTASTLLFLAGASSILSSNAFSLRPISFLTSTRVPQRFGLFGSTEPKTGDAQPHSNTKSNAGGSSVPSTPPPVLNGKTVLPMRVVMTGLEGHTLPAVYAVIRSGWARGTDGWPQTEYIGRTTNLYESLQTHLSEHGSDKVAHVRALSFSFPQEGAMQSVVNEWTEAAMAAGAVLKDWGLVEAQMAMMAYEDDDDDDDDDDEWDMDGISGAVSSSVVDKVISPFASSEEGAAAGTALDFTLANVDKVLEEVRPYLISDGGNVSVQKVDLGTNQVFLKLEGACGSCPSSTVTMKMGIERVLKENFPNAEVVQVEDESGKPTELTYEAIEQEVKRIQPAIIAMGGVVQIIKVDPIGEVTLDFRGANKVRQGLEMALLDIPFCKHVKFVSS